MIKQRHCVREQFQYTVNVELNYNLSLISAKPFERMYLRKIRSGYLHQQLVLPMPTFPSNKL